MIHSIPLCRPAGSNYWAEYLAALARARQINAIPSVYK